MTVAGKTVSTNFPTIGAYDTTYNGSSSRSFSGGDAFVSRLDPSKTVALTRRQDDFPAGPPGGLKVSRRRA
ncbi:MAG: hypothetical protein ACE5F1_00760 [Planctomycetota bacterium]